MKSFIRHVFFYRHFRVTAVLIIPFITCSICKAQNEPIAAPALQTEPVFEEYQFYLTDPAVKILDLRYEQDCQPADGKISDDGKTVFLRNYRKHSRIYFKYLKADGKIEEVFKSSCFIDPVVHLL